MANRQHGANLPMHHPSGNRGNHSIEGFNEVSDEAARNAIVQTSADRGRTVYQTAGDQPGWYLARGETGQWQWIGDGSGGSSTSHILSDAIEVCIDPVNGDDGNGGLSWDAPWQTWAPLLALLVHVIMIDALILVRLAPGTHRLVQLLGLIFRDWIILYPDEQAFPDTAGAGVYTSAGTYTVAAGTDENQLHTTVAIPSGHCAWLRVTSGAGAGQRRSMADVAGDAATVIRPALPFDPVPEPGDTVEIFTPEVVLRPPDATEGIGSAFAWVHGSATRGHGGICVIGCALGESNWWTALSIAGVDAQFFGCRPAGVGDSCAVALEAGARAYFGSMYPPDWGHPSENLGGKIPNLDDASDWDGWGITSANSMNPRPNAPDALASGTFMNAAANDLFGGHARGRIEVYGGWLGFVHSAGGYLLISGWSSGCPVRVDRMQMADGDTVASDLVGLGGTTGENATFRFLFNARGTFYASVLGVNPGAASGHYTVFVSEDAIVYLKTNMGLGSADHDDIGIRGGGDFNKADFAGGVPQYFQGAAIRTW